MKKLIFAAIIGIITFASCTPEYVNLKMIDNGEIIQKVYNRISASYGDTVLYQDYYTEDGLLSGKKHEYDLVTNDEFEEGKKFIQWHYGTNHPSDEYPDWISKDVTARKAIVIKP